MSGQIPVSEAERISKLYDQDEVIIVSRQHGTETYTITTYGKNKELCKQTARDAHYIHALISSKSPEDFIAKCK